MKFIENINGVIQIDKSAQKNYNGGNLTLQPQDCATQCASSSAYAGQKCGVGTHCPGECDGRGGWWPY